MVFHFFALAAHGTGISGGDRIFMELTRRWSKKHEINLYVTQEGKEMCRRNKLQVLGIKYRVSNMKKSKGFGFLINYLARILEGVKLGLTLRLDTSSTLITYSASEFWMDSLPALILKIRYPKTKWVAAWYQTAPNPLKGFWGGRYKLSVFYYWFMQKPIKPLISKFADFVLVNNEEERKQFNRLNKEGKVFVFIGAVDLERIEKWKASATSSLKNRRLPKVYDAVFQGRFHPQKGVVELINIWKKVVEKKPGAKLAMIGDGPLRKAVEKRIKNYELGNNVKLLGYLFDGPKKYRVFAQSKIVVHPAFYDSGGMAAAEAMAFGLPCVGFDLASYKSYYPEGMVKVELGDKNAFVDEILILLKNVRRRKEIAKEAVNMIKTNWSWESRANQALKFINE